MAAPESPRPSRTYGNWRRPVSPGLGGLGALGTALLLVGAVVVLLALMSGGLGPATGVGAGLVTVLVLIVVRDRYHRSGVDRLLTWLGWALTTASGSHLYRSGPLSGLPLGRCQLPGIAAVSRLSEWSDPYGRPFALLELPTTRHITVVLAADPDGAALVDEDQIDSWVAHWGAWLTSLGNEPDIVAAGLIVETAPDTGARLRREVAAHLDPAAPAVARQMLTEAVADYPHGSAGVRVWITVTLTTARPGRRIPVADAARDVAVRLPGLLARLAATGAGAVRPVPAQELCEAIRVAYDPAAAAVIDPARAAGDAPALRWDDVGPVTAHAGYRDYIHDDAVSVSWVMSSPPRGEVHATVLTQLLAPHPDVARKRVALLYRPIPAAVTARIVERDRRAADFRATTGRRPSARVLAEQRAMAATAAEEARGAGLVDVSLVVTATVTSPDRLPAALAAVDHLGATARLQLRPAYGHQDSAFAAALPLGLVLAAHQRVPTDIRRLL
ncbi:MAG: SCO6880 family protein [Kineosporiaceae bacterium]